MLSYYPAPWSNNVWTPWVKYLTGQDEVKDVAMIKHKNHETIACSKKFVPSSSDIKSMKDALEDKTVDRVMIKNTTYMLLPRPFTSDPNMVIGFRGDEYVIVATSHTMYVVMVLKRCKSSDGTSERVRRSLVLMKKVTARLLNNDY